MEVALGTVREAARLIVLGTALAIAATVALAAVLATAPVWWIDLLDRRENASVLNHMLMNLLDSIQTALPEPECLHPAYAGMYSFNCSDCSGSCYDSCSGDCDGSCAGTCEDVCDRTCI